MQDYLIQKIGALLSRVINPSGEAPVYHCLIRINCPGEEFVFQKAYGISGPANKSLDSGILFRTGSISKIFTATLIHQLMEANDIDPESSFFAYLNADHRRFLKKIHRFEGKSYSDKISINDLLRHSSGLCDYYSEDQNFLGFVMKNTQKRWTWTDVMGKYFEFSYHERSRFIPGQDYHYSDTNYLLLAVLAEDLGGKKLHELYKEQITEDLKLKNTSLAFYEEKSKKEVLFPFYGKQNMIEINTSFDWGAGGLLSDLGDLDHFIRSLFEGKVFKEKSTVNKMISGAISNTNLKKGQDPFHGPGLQKKVIGDQVFYGHNSAYGGQLFYDPVKKISIIFTLNQMQAFLKAEWLFRALAKEMVKLFK